MTTALRVLLRVLAGTSVLLFVLLIMPTALVLVTESAPWPDDLTPPPLHSGELGEFVWADFHNWLGFTYDRIRSQLPLDYFVFLTALLALWALWATLICGLTATTYDLLRYGAHRLRAEGPQGVRGWITAVVTSTVLAGTTAPTAAAALPTGHTATAPREPGDPDPQHTPESTPDDQAPPLTSAGYRDPDPSLLGPAAYVHRGDSLWTLAKEHLGDGNRWREIADLNHLSPRPQGLLAGQWLRMPPDAIRLHPSDVPDGAQWVTVTSGDTLAGIAAQYLGDPHRWPEIFELNRGRTQQRPSHTALYNPDLLIPGWTLAIPPSGTASEPPAPPELANTTPPPAPEPAPARPPAAPAVPAAAPRHEPATEAQPSLRVVGGVVVGLAAAGALTASAYRWRRRAPRAPAAPMPSVYPVPVSLRPIDPVPPAHSEVTNDAGVDGKEHSPLSRAEPVRPGVERVSPQQDEADGHGRPTPVEPTAGAGQGEGAAAGISAWEWELRPAPAAPAVPPAGEAEAASPEPPPAGRGQARVTVFGSPRLHWHPGTEGGEREVALQPRMVSVLAFLALHPRGAGREEILTALWGEHATGSNALHTTLTRLRRTLAGHDPVLAGLVVAEDGRRYRINPELATVDYWRFTAAQAARRRARSEHDRGEADQALIDVYTGPLADGLDAPWAEPARAHAHRAFLDAVAARAHALRESAPQHTLDMLEHAREFAPDHEPLYRDIMRLQAHLGLHESIPRTLALLQAHLATVDAIPSDTTRALAEHLQHP